MLAAYAVVLGITMTTVRRGALVHLPSWDVLAVLM